MPNGMPNPFLMNKIYRFMVQPRPLCILSLYRCSYMLDFVCFSDEDNAEVTADCKFHLMSICCPINYA